MRTAWLLLVAACSTTTTTDAVTDSDAPPGAAPDTDETGLRWGPDDDGAYTDDTFRLSDTPIPPTPFDGRWAGTFDLKVVRAIGKNPKCTGTFELVVDPTAFRHVTASFACDTWEPNLPDNLVSKPYGQLTGVGYGTIDTADQTGFTLNAALGALNMTTWDATLRFTYDGTRLSAAENTVTGALGINEGRDITLEATRAP